MKLYSWNVNGLRAVLKKGALQSFLGKEHPDILCLQEIKAKPEQIDYDFEGYQVYYNSAEKPGYSGTAILVKEKQPVLAGDVPGGGHPKMFCEAKILGEEGAAGPALNRSEPFFENKLDIATSEGRVMVLDCEKFYLVNVYTPNSKPDLSRLRLRETAWDPDFLKLLKQLEQEKPVVTCGDFNAAHEEIDLARPKTNHQNAGFTDEERKGITNLINAGFLDTFRTLNPETKRYTWWSHWANARKNNVGWRIDYFFISKSLKKNLKSAEIYERYEGSDHCPISIDLEF